MQTFGPPSSKARDGDSLDQFCETTIDCVHRVLTVLSGLRAPTIWCWVGHKGVRSSWPSSVYRCAGSIDSCPVVCCSLFAALWRKLRGQQNADERGRIVFSFQTRWGRQLCAVAIARFSQMRCETFANGWITCSWFMSCGDRSVRSIEQYQNTNQARSRKPFAKSQIQSQTKEKPRCLSSVACGLRQHLKASLSCKSLETMGQWSKWSFRAEVQRWDTCHEPNRVALDWLFDRINVDSKIQIKMLTPKTNSQTC